MLTLHSRSFIAGNPPRKESLPTLSDVQAAEAEGRTAHVINTTAFALTERARPTCLWVLRSSASPVSIRY
jgi:hypothetical protein